MDQPRPRPDAEQRPLIIERPDLAHPVRRVLAFVLTLLAWIGFIAMWLPVFDVAALSFDLPLPSDALPRFNNVIALSSLLDVFPLTIGLLLLVLAANGMISRVYRRFSKPTVHRFVGTQQLATGMALDAHKLAAWQEARILHVEHSPMGGVVNARIVR